MEQWYRKSAQFNTEIQHSGVVQGSKKNRNNSAPYYVKATIVRDSCLQFLEEAVKDTRRTQQTNCILASPLKTYMCGKLQKRCHINIQAGSKHQIIQRRQHIISKRVASDLASVLYHVTSGKRTTVLHHTDPWCHGTVPLQPLYLEYTGIFHSYLESSY